MIPRTWRLEDINDTIEFASPESSSKCNLRLEIVVHIHFLVQVDVTIDFLQVDMAHLQIGLYMPELCITIVLFALIFRPTSLFRKLSSYSISFISWALFAMRPTSSERHKWLSRSELMLAPSFQFIFPNTISRQAVKILDDKGSPAHITLDWYGTGLANKKRCVC